MLENLKIKSGVNLTKKLRCTINKAGISLCFSSPELSRIPLLSNRFPSVETAMKQSHILENEVDWCTTLVKTQELFTTTMVSSTFILKAVHVNYEDSIFHDRACPDGNGMEVDRCISSSCADWLSR